MFETLKVSEKKSMSISTQNHGEKWCYVIVTKQEIIINTYAYAVPLY